MGTGAPITGSAGTSIAAQFSRVAAGTTVLAGDVNQGLTSCVDDLATIKSGAHHFAGVKTFDDPVTFDDTVTKKEGTTILAAGSGAQINGVWSAGGAWTFATGATFSSGATCAIASGGTFSAASGSTCTLAGTVSAMSTSKVSLLGRVVPRSARVGVADDNKTIGVAAGSGIDYSGKRFLLAAVPGSPRTITLAHANATPEAEETMEVLWRSGTVGAGTQYTFQREDATVVATFVGPTDATYINVWAEFEYSGGVWKLGASSGSSYDDTADYGVIPGAGA